ncbi:hypothetical protein ACFSW8_13580 [Rubritalea tangerina]|uniref:Uncharacterized protein n=3 Tax=Rubritalea tangerina TaxID=430798 RepID=A0ABW4ZD43_9BACT
MLFGMSVAMTGIVHQTIWVAKSPILQSNRYSPANTAITQARILITHLHLASRGNLEDFPENLESLVHSSQELTTKELYYQPADKAKLPEPWVYCPPSPADTTLENIVLHSSTPSFSGKWLVARANTSVELIDEAQFRQLLTKTKNMTQSD